MSGLLITGTDTGVGKTWVACHLIKALVASGLRVGVMKPCETGIVGGPRPERLAPGCDAQLLLEASGCKAAVQDVLPYAFRLPAAPAIAALEEGCRIEYDELEAAYGRLNEDHDLVIVEGAGGVLVPLAPGLDFLGLASRLDLETLIVARTGLGTVNHTGLTERALAANGCPPLGIVLNSPSGAVSGCDRVNLGALAQVLTAPVLAEMPYGNPPKGSMLDPLVDAVREALKV
jgi:dethiobiotin synthetase